MTITSEQLAAWERPVDLRTSLDILDAIDHYGTAKPTNEAVDELRRLAVSNLKALVHDARAAHKQSTALPQLIAEVRRLREALTAVVDYVEVAGLLTFATDDEARKAVAEARALLNELDPPTADGVAELEAERKQ